MKRTSDQANPEPGASARVQIDALLDEALQESFPASDSSAIGSGISAIKQEDRERQASKDSLPRADPDGRVTSNEHESR